MPITVYYYGDYQPSQFTVRKYTSANGSYATLPGARLTRVTLAGQPALRLQYEVADGGVYDQDGQANGTIVDPVGLGTSNVGVPNTGIGR